MARIRQTARKSTGGTAPRRPLRNVDREPSRYLNDRRSSSQRQIRLKGSRVHNTRSKARQNTSSPAQKRVLSSPDLLIIILSQLPHSSLLTAKGVNRTWASLFEHVEIRAALFQVPRPKGSAIYTEAQSDILMNIFSHFWPEDNQDPPLFSNSLMRKSFHNKNWTGSPTEILNSCDRLDTRRERTDWDQPQQQQEVEVMCPYRQQWQQLLVSQPPIEALELIQEVDVRGHGIVEFRAVVPCPNGLRMGFLYDAVKHWLEVERSSATVVWDRRVGEDVSDPTQLHTCSNSFMALAGKRCISILGYTSYGCGQYGGLTFANRDSGPVIQFIQSGSEEVEYRMVELA